MIHSFLLIGQSNMAGRGFKAEVEPIPNKDIYVLRNGRWWPMYVPVNPDRVTAGINLSESFAYRYLQDHPGVQVGLIPCADGGTSLNQWAPGGVLFDHAVMMAGLARRTSEIRGILWHQGESDCSDELYPLYEEKCTRIMNALRAELGLENTPLLLGGLGDYLLQYKKDMTNYVHVNAALEEMARKLPNTGFVSAAGLGANPDNLHFSAAALRAFGERYYAVFRTLQQAEGAGSADTGDALNITEIEKL